MWYANAMAVAQKLKFSVGDSIVYPGYGVGQVTELQERALSDGQKQTFLVLAFKETENESKVMVPLSNLQRMGLRAPSPRKVVKEALAYLGAGSSDIVASWKERFSQHSDLLRWDTENQRGGELADVVRVLKALYILNKKKPLSFREKKMYQKALLLTTSEVALVLGKSRDEMEAQVLKLLEAGS